MITIKINGVAYRAVKSSQLSTKCKKIFGVALQAAYIVDNYRLESSFNSKKDSVEYFRRANTALDLSGTPSIVEFDSYEIILEFKGGNCVFFSSSEWASFAKVEVEVESN